MSRDDRQLIEQIADQVVRAIQIQRRSDSQTPPRASIAPPAGVCTGDYSKFTELSGKPIGGGPPQARQAPAPEAQASPASSVVPLTGIVTANQLQAAMSAAGDGVAVLAADCRLSPLASDLARQFPQRIRRVNASAATAQPGADLPWLWWSDGHCPAVAGVVTRLARRLTQSSASHRTTALAQVVRDLASAIKTRRVQGGLLFVHNAARAMCYANRCSSIRAVVGTCGEAVEQGITELGANVLVIEYPHHGQRAISAMVDRIMQQPPQAPPSVERELSDLHRC